MLISVICPTLRTTMRQAMIDTLSVGNEMYSFEIIFVGPYDIPLKSTPNISVRYIKDTGSPVRAIQVGLVNATGDYLLNAADDGVFLNNDWLHDALAFVKNWKDVVSFRFTEGLMGNLNDPQNQRKINKWRLLHDDSWLLKRINDLPFILPHFKQIGSLLVHREYLLEVGGWDCTFSNPTVAGCDLAARLGHDGANVKMGKIFMQMSFIKGTDGDHAPIVVSDKAEWPLYIQRWSNPDSVNLKIKSDNWKSSPSVWNLRFGEGV